MYICSHNQEDTHQTCFVSRPKTYSLFFVLQPERRNMDRYNDKLTHNNGTKPKKLDPAIALLRVEANKNNNKTTTTATTKQADENQAMQKRLCVCFELGK